MLPLLLCSSEGSHHPFPLPCSTGHTGSPSWVLSYLPLASVWIPELLVCLAPWLTLTLVAYASQMGCLLGGVLYLRLVEIVVERDAGLSQKAPCVLVTISIRYVSVSMAASVALLLGSTGSQCRALDPSPLAHLSPESRAGKGRVAVLREGKYFLVLPAALRAPPPLSAESPWVCFCRPPSCVTHGSGQVTLWSDVP